MNPVKFNEKAKKIASDLMAQLKAGEIKKIGRDEIEYLAIHEFPPHSKNFESLVSETCLQVCYLTLVK
jgi:hypothetical protein